MRCMVFQICNSILDANISMSIGNNTMNETSVTKFLGIHLDKKLNFVNHITEML